jgi:hypothetical protein
MKLKTSELTGAALDWAVAKCEGHGVGVLDDPWFMPSTNWSQSGPIIERERVQVRFIQECYWHFATPTDTWIANYDGGGEWIGPTPLIAAMRCFVASRLGESVDVPSELCGDSEAAGDAYLAEQFRRADSADDSAY